MNQREYFARVAALGCVICESSACVHHASGLKYRAKGRKADWWNVFPLCPTHHQYGGHGVAIHAGVKTWEAKYGSQDKWIAWTQERCGYSPAR